MVELGAWSCAYPPRQRLLRPAWAALRLSEMAIAAMKSQRYDVTFIQREMLSTFATLERWTGRARVLDVDDSIHLYRGGTMAKALATQCDRIICGNPHLAEIYRQWNKDVVVLPTAVDTVRFCPKDSNRACGSIVLGWIGTSGNLKYLHEIEPALVAVLKQNSNAKLHVVCDRPPDFRDIKTNRFKFIPWSPEIEVAAIQSFSIGLMPLMDSPWARGKCSFKMLQYMACGVPVVVSPVGMNADVLNMGEIGFGPVSLTQWVDAMAYFLADENARLRSGVNGRQIVLRDFSVAALAPQLAIYLGS